MVCRLRLLAIFVVLVLDLVCFAILCVWLFWLLGWVVLVVCLVGLALGSLVVGAFDFIVCF